MTNLSHFLPHHILYGQRDSHDATAHSVNLPHDEQTTLEHDAVDQLLHCTKCTS